MKKIFIYFSVITAILTSCATTAPIKKSIAYEGMYKEQPLTILLMPPINRSTAVDAKEYFYATLNVPLNNKGFYVLPPFLTMDVLKRESAYDAELFINGSLSKFGEIFGADIALFTIIEKWDKSSIGATVTVSVEYIAKSTRTNETLYTRKGTIVYDASVKSGSGGAIGALLDMAASAINTAATKYVDVGRVCNSYTFKDFPSGKYSPNYNLDGEELAGAKDFKARLNSNYK
jgi:hypothetical protein